MKKLLLILLALGCSSPASTRSDAASPDGATGADANSSPDGGSTLVAPRLVAEYVDSAGAIQSVQVAADGSTTITGVAPLFMFFDASSSRSATETTDVAAWWDLGYRLNYGEALGGTWPFGGASRDEDLGEPIFGRAFTRIGNNMVRLRVKDSVGNEATLSLTVTTTAPPAPTIIEPSAGVWPTFASNRHYQLRAGADYRGFGDLQCNGVHNVVFSKVGAGADPRIARFSPEGRGLSATLLTPSANVRLVDIDTEQLHMSVLGPRYVGAVRGRVRTIEGDPIYYIYDNSADTPGTRENIRYPHGVFLWDTGELNPPVGAQYVMITGLRNFVAQGIDVHKNQATGNHALRNEGEHHIYRHFRLRASVPSASLVKHQAGTGTTPWTAADQYGTVTGAKAKHDHPASKFVMQSGVFHAPGSTIPDICVGAGAENNDVGGQVGAVEFMAFSDSVSGQNAWQLVAGNDVQMNGRGLATRNIRLDQGTGIYATQSAGAYINNVPAGWNGPYRYETVNTRPIPTPF